MADISHRRGELVYVIFRILMVLHILSIVQRKLHIFDVALYDSNETAKRYRQRNNAALSDPDRGSPCKKTALQNIL